jgi:hypothetical protein
LVLVYSVLLGKAMGKFLSATEEGIYDICVITSWGATRVAATGADIVINHERLDGQNDPN